MLFENHVIFVLHFIALITWTFSEDEAEKGIGYFPKLFDPNRRNIPENKQDIILGGPEEAEQYRYLTPEESKQRLSLLITKIDQNNDKILDPCELHEWIFKSFLKFAENEADALFEFVDSNKDGKITWEEQVENLYKLIRTLKENDTKAELTLKKNKRLFEAADTDKNGILNKTEYRRVCNPENFDDMIPVIIENIVEEDDANKDGVIDLEEHIVRIYPEKKQDKNFIAAQKEGFERNLDLNKNGILDREEILTLIAPSSSQMANEEVNVIFIGADKNDDKQLSFEEVIENYHVFVHSEATKYGEHLQNIQKVMDEL